MVAVVRRRGVRTVIPCQRCGESFGPRTVAKFCITCRPAAEAARLKRYAETHRELTRAIKTKWRLAHPDKQDASAKRWRDANAEKVRGYRRAAKKRNPVANRSYVRARKARLQHLSVIPFTPDQLRQRFSMFSGCWMCGAVAGTIDHVKPLAHGGAHILANLRPACLTCNSRKGDRWPLEAAA